MAKLTIGKTLILNEAAESTIPDDVTIGGVLNVGSIQGIRLSQTGGAEVCGIGTLGGTGTVTITTSQADSGSLFFITPRSTFSGSIYVDHSALVPGESFTVTSTAGMADGSVNFYWLIIRL